MPVPKASKLETETVPATPVETLGASPVTPVAPLTAPIEGLGATGVTEGLGDTSGTTTGTFPKAEEAQAPKARRGRKPGAPMAPPFDQQMFFIMRAQARKLASQQQAAGLAVEVDPAKLLEAVKSYPGFEDVDRSRLVSKYKEGLKQIADHAKGEEINGAGLEHPLYLPPLTQSRAKIDWLAMDEG